MHLMLVHNCTWPPHTTHIMMIRSTARSERLVPGPLRDGQQAARVIFVVAATDGPRPCRLAVGSGRGWFSLSPAASVGSCPVLLLFILVFMHFGPILLSMSPTQSPLGQILPDSQGAKGAPLPGQWATPAASPQSLPDARTHTHMPRLCDHRTLSLPPS